MTDRPLLRRFPGLRLPLVPLLDAPTPVRRVPVLESRTGAASVHVKDDGRSAPPYGGNKPRKLEWLLGEARGRGAREVIAIGADGSNYCLATAVHGTRAGFDVTLIVAPQPPMDAVRRNLLAAAAGATYVPTGSDAALLAELTRRVAAGRMGGNPPYPTWFGGSTPLGAVGFVNAALELMEQVADGALPHPDVVVVPTGSVGSHAGLEVGLRLAGTDPLPRVVGVRVTPKIMGNARVVTMTANRCAALLRRKDPSVPPVRLRARDVTVREGFFGSGYGVPTPEGEAALELMAAEGIPLDPTYSAKTLAALLDDDSLAGRNVVFWNTYNACPLDALPQASPEDLPAALRERHFAPS